MQHVNPSFSILAPEIKTETAQLFAEAGPMGLSLVVLDEGNTFTAVISYSFTEGLPDNEIAEMLKVIFANEQLLQKTFSKTHIFWSFPDSILVPAALMNTERNSKMLDLVYGDAINAFTRSDFLYKHNLHNVYRTPQEVVDVFSVYLPVATQTHLFSTIVNQDLPEGNYLYALLYNHSVTLMLVREGKLQVIQNFRYHSPDDCVFHLLNICKGFDVLPDSVNLRINGLIDKQSELYAAIYKYFLQIEFESLPDGYQYDAVFKEYPPHFFSHLFALPACV